MSTRPGLTAAVLLVALLAWGTPVHADVIDSSASGFTVRNTVEIASPRGNVYGRLVGDVGRWWNPAHTFSGDAHNLSIGGEANGCFCEKLKDGGSIRHMTVIYAQPGVILRMAGAIGPLQPMGVTGTMTWSLKESGAGTTLEVTYAVGGYSPHGLQRIAVAADLMLKEQIGRLKAYIETGSAGPEERK
jgi:hypothetical protein